MATQTGSYDFRAAKAAAAKADAAQNLADALETSLSDLDSFVRGGTYFATSDTVALADKIYYTRTGSGTDDDPYVYTDADVSEGDSVIGLYELDDSQSVVGQMAAGQAELADSIDGLSERTDALEIAQDGIHGDIDTLADGLSSVSGTVDDAVYREQTIWFAASYGTTSKAKNETWVTDVSGGPNMWTAAHPYDSVEYPVLFSAIQRQAMSQRSTDSCSCTDPVMSMESVQFNGAKLIANSVTVEKIDVESLRAALLQAEELLIGDTSGAHMEADGNRLSFKDGSGNEVAYIDIDSDGNSTFYMTRSIVVDDMFFGDGLWKFYRRSNRNMSIKWMGGE